MTTKISQKLKVDISRSVNLDKLVKGIALKLRKEFFRPKSDGFSSLLPNIYPENYPSGQDQYELHLMLKHRLISKVPPIEFGDGELYSLTSKAEKLYKELCDGGFYKRKD